MNYRKDFKKYLADLGAKKPAPGGGSAICLSFCLGVSLIEKAVNYSLENRLNAGCGCFLFNAAMVKKYICRLEKIKRKVLPYIDLDGQIFGMAMRTKGEERKALLKESEKLIIDVGKLSLSMFSLAKEIESGIKKGIISDFNIGLEFIKTTFKGCIANLEVNTVIFGKKSKYLDIFKKVCLD